MANLFTPFLCITTLLSTIIITTFASASSFNVRSYGAIGDGVHDDTSAVINAVQAMLSSGDEPASLVFVSGEYLLNGNIAGVNNPEFNLSAGFIQIPLISSGSQQQYTIAGIDTTVSNVTILWNSEFGSLVNISTTEGEGGAASPILNMYGFVINPTCTVIGPNTVGDKSIISATAGVQLILNDLIINGGSCPGNTSVISANAGSASGSTGTLFVTNMQAQDLETFIQVDGGAYEQVTVQNISLSWIENGVIVKNIDASPDPTTPTQLSLSSMSFTNIDHGVTILGHVNATLSQLQFLTNLPVDELTWAVKIGYATVEEGQNTNQEQVNLYHCSFQDTTSSPLVEWVQQYSGYVEMKQNLFQDGKYAFTYQPTPNLPSPPPSSPSQPRFTITQNSFASQLTNSVIGAGEYVFVEQNECNGTTSTMDVTCEQQPCQIGMNWNC